MNQITEISISKPANRVMQYYRCFDISPKQTSSWLYSNLLPVHTMFFVLANLSDILMTSILLDTGAFREANPLANFVLENWGLGGMVIFKLGFVAGIILIAQYIATQQLGTAKALLNIGTAMVATVVFYSALLFANFVGLI